MKPAVHFTDNSLLQPPNPIMVNLIGAGGTGSQMLTALARINHSLVALRQPGICVRLFDDDVVTEANLGRQLFAPSELGLNKAVALINRLNRFFGTNWKAVTEKYTTQSSLPLTTKLCATITVSCVDSAAARFDIAELLQQRTEEHMLHQPLYWMDFGNSRDTGQVILSTVTPIKQPNSKKFTPVDTLPLITEEFKYLLQQAGEDDQPSCSLAEALLKQDLFINSSLANLGSSLLWQLFREGMITNRGFFLNLRELKTQPIKITAPVIPMAKKRHKQAA